MKPFYARQKRKINGPKTKQNRLKLTKKYKKNIKKKHNKTETDRHKQKPTKKNIKMVNFIINIVSKTLVLCAHEAIPCRPEQKYINAPKKGKYEYKLTNKTHKNK